MGKSYTKPILILLFILMLIAGIVCLVLYLTTDMFKSPGVLFSKYFIKNFGYVQDLGYEPYSNLNKIIGQRTYDESANIMLKSNNNQTYEYTNKFVSDSVNSKFRDILSFYQNDHDVNIVINRDVDLYAVNLNNITSKKIAIRNSGLKTALNQIGYTKTEYLPNRVSFNPYREYDEEKFETANKNFIKIFQDSINANSFNKEKDSVISYNGQNVNSNKYYVKTNGKTIISFIEKVINEFKSNPNTYGVYANFFGLDNDTFISLLTYLKDRLSNYITNHELLESDFQINVYEYQGNLISTEIYIGKAKVELKFNKVEGKATFQYLYNNIDYTTYQTDLYRNIKFENEYTSDSSNITIDYSFKKKNSNDVLEENNYKFKIALNNITDSGANRSIIITKNNTLIFNYDATISIDIDAHDLENISPTNSYILNDATNSELQKMNQELKSHLNEIINVLNVIPYRISSNVITNDTGEDTHLALLVNNNDANTVRDDLNNAFTSLCANYILNPEEAGSLSEYLTVNRIKNKTMYAQEINILEGNIIEYYNQNGNIYRAQVEILGDKVNILNVEMYIPEIEDPVVEPEPEPEPEPVIEPPTVVPDHVEPEPEEPQEPIEDNRDHEAIQRMKDDINNLLPLIEQQAAIDERSIDDFVTSDNFVNNCPNIVRMDIEEQSSGMYLVKAYDEAGNEGSGVLQVFEYGINLLIFD